MIAISARLGASSLMSRGLLSQHAYAIPVTTFAKGFHTSKAKRAEGTGGATKVGCSWKLDLVTMADYVKIVVICGNYL